MINDCDLRCEKHNRDYHFIISAARHTADGKDDSN